MTKSIGIARVLTTALVAVVHFLGSTAQAHNTRAFSTLNTVASASAKGQIDWPAGELISWTGPVIVFISAGSPSDRDGWLVLARNTVWNARSPLKELSAALVAKGMAVVRFDHPAVRSPSSKCRAALNDGAFTERTISAHCLNIQVLSRLSVDAYDNSVESVINHVLKLVPRAKERLVLFGFSEGLQHATTILNRNNVTPSAMISIGSPAQCLRKISHWQAIDRVIQTLPEFDSNNDGIVTNTEITHGYDRGVGQIALSSSAWLNPRGEWRQVDIDAFRTELEEQYAELKFRAGDVGQQDPLTYVRDKNGILVPDVTKSFWRMHFLSEVSSLESVVRRRIPALFIWGDEDRRLPISQQADLVNAAKEVGAPVEVVRLPARFHMLSAKSDIDWFEPALAPVIAETVKNFLLQSR